jgi:YVTN family beta-propeller protein
MRSRTLLSFIITMFLFALLSGCSSPAGCPTCGTTVNGSYGVINIIPVPEHNPTGEPGGPFNSFDISLVDPVHHLFFVSDRIGLDVVVVDTINNVAINTIDGQNSVAQAGNNASPCFVPPLPAPQVSPIQPLLDASGQFTRFGCRTNSFTLPGFGASGLFGGFPGAQCCAARANGVNPLSAPDGETITADGKTLFVGNGSSSVVVFDLTTNPPTVIATIPTGQSPTYDSGPAGIAPCVASANGRAFSDPSCGDLRADEMSYDEKDKILLVANGDPGFPFVTLIDMSAVVARTGNCLPVTPGNPYGPTNFPTCILGQIYYDGAGNNFSTVPVDNQPGFPCPDPSTTAPSGVSGTGVGAGGKNVPCHHGPVITSSGVFCNQVTPGAGCNGAISPAGVGGSAFNPNTGHFLVTNANATGDLTIGTIDEIDPRIGNPNGPIVINTFPVKNCMPGGIVQGPGNNFLVGCADHDGVAFPPNEYVIDGSSGKILATIDKVGGVDETWYNPGDNRYYLAARDMPGGPVLGVIDAGTNQWLQNVTTNSNSHSIAVDPSNNHVFVPMQAGTICTTQSANGCIAVYARQ